MKTFVFFLAILAALAQGQENVADFLEKFHSPESYDRQGAIRYISSNFKEHPELVEYLIKALTDPDESVRCTAQSKISEADRAMAEKLMPLLLDAALDANELLRCNALESIGLLVGYHRSEAMPVVEKDLGHVLSVLEQSLYHQNSEVRLYAAFALKSMEESASPSVPVLLPLLTDPDAGVRYQVVDSLGRIATRPEMVISALVKTLNNKNEEANVRGVAALSLGLQGLKVNGEAINVILSTLANALKEQDVNIKIFASWACTRIGHKNTKIIVPALLDALSDTNVTVRIEIIIALTQIRRECPSINPEIVEIITHIANSTTDRLEKELALNLLGEIRATPKRKREILIDILTMRFKDIPSKVQEQIYKIDSTEKLDPLIALSIKCNSLDEFTEQLMVGAGQK